MKRMGNDFLAKKRNFLDKKHLVQADGWATGQL